MNRILTTCFVIVFAVAGIAPAAEPLAPALPGRLSETGLYAAGTLTIHPDNHSYAPQYPLWSDGASKRRWLYLPPGTSIDASNPDAWEFPRGTRLWKEFGFGRPIETRMVERLADGSWRFSTYVWNAEGSDALLAPEAGFASIPAPDAPGGSYGIPSRDDCLACHEGATVPVLGVSAIQLSPERDALAPHAEPAGAPDIDLNTMVARGLLENLPQALIDNPPRIDAPSPAGRSALGYLHANCGHCHNDAGPLSVLEMVLAQETAAAQAAADKVLATLVLIPSDFRMHGLDTRVVPGLPAASILVSRMKSRNPLTQMPPLGTNVPDVEGIALIERWIQEQQANDRSKPDETS